MKIEGMVHALEEIRRLLKPGGILVDIHPIPEGSLTEARRGESVLFSGITRETCSEAVIQAEKALAQVVDRGLFVVEKRARFDFFTYASSAGELSAYWEELEAFDSTPQDDPQTIREKYLYARVDEALREFGEGAEAVTHERARITSMKSLQS